MAIHVTPIPKLTTLTTPAFTLGTTNTAGSAITAVASNSTILTYDATVPTTIDYGASAAAGDTATAARRNHTHGMQAASGICKMWAKVDMDGSPGVIDESFNTAGYSDTGTGKGTITIGTDFANADYAPTATVIQGAAFNAHVDTPLVGSIKVVIYDASNNLADTKMAIACFGDQ